MAEIVVIVMLTVMMGNIVTVRKVVSMALVMQAVTLVHQVLVVMKQPIAVILLVIAVVVMLTVTMDSSVMVMRPVTTVSAWQAAILAGMVLPVTKILTLVTPTQEAVSV
ncbi:MAG: hypothetical protein H6765_01865 [Candidatus Peribacteria bacterium]|nr:MAG: hypothetical protein H6765_01865 [Candidatus Peribacteria bacterium]